MRLHVMSPLSGPVRSRPKRANTVHQAPFRAELVDRVRREIANGTYETAHKWEVALGRLLQEIQTKS
jgi:hypothetical protein